MDWNQAEGQWLQLTGKVKEQWGKLTDDDLALIAGKRDQLIGRLQEHYAFGLEEAEKQVDAWIGTVSSVHAANAPPAMSPTATP